MSVLGVKTKVACCEVGVAGAQVRSLFNRSRLGADRRIFPARQKRSKENSLRCRNFLVNSALLDAEHGKRGLWLTSCPVNQSGNCSNTYTL